MGAPKRTASVSLAIVLVLAVVPTVAGHLQEENAVQMPEGTLEGEEFLIHSDPCTADGEHIAVQRDDDASRGFFLRIPAEGCTALYGATVLATDLAEWTNARIRIPHPVDDWEICYELRLSQNGVPIARSDFCDEGRKGWYAVPFDQVLPGTSAIQTVQLTYTIDDERTDAPLWCKERCNLHVDLLRYNNRTVLPGI